MVGYYAKTYFFISESKKIEKRLHELGSLFVRTKNENIIGSAKKIIKAIDYFQAPIDILVIGEVGYKKTFSDVEKTQLKDTLTTVKFRQSWVNVKFQDLETIVVEKSADSAVIVRLEFEDSNQGLVFDEFPLKIVWEKIDDEWFIRGVEVDMKPNSQET